MIMELLKIFSSSLSNKERKELRILITKILSHQVTNDSTKN